MGNSGVGEGEVARPQGLRLLTLAYAMSALLFGVFGAAGAFGLWFLVLPLAFVFGFCAWFLWRRSDVGRRAVITVSWMLLIPSLPLLLLSTYTGVVFMDGDAYMADAFVFASLVFLFMSAVSVVLSVASISYLRTPPIRALFRKVA